jgi:hypothetical protein
MNDAPTPLRCLKLLLSREMSDDLTDDQDSTHLLSKYLMRYHSCTYVFVAFEDRRANRR